MVVLYNNNEPDTEPGSELRNRPAPDELEFVVAAVSSNTNSFGLRSVILVARDGTALEGLRTTQFCPMRGNTIWLKRPLLDSLMRLGYECPRDLPEAPAAVIEEVWAKTTQR